MRAHFRRHVRNWIRATSNFAIVSTTLIASVVSVPCAASAAKSSPNNTSESPSKPIVRLSQIMTRAAFEYPSVLAKEKEIQSSAANRTATALDQLTLSGSIGYSDLKGQMSIEGVGGGVPGGGFPGINGPIRQTTKRQAVGISLMLSLQTWFQLKGMSLSEQMQESALMALRMQLATDAADALMKFYFNDSRHVLLGSFRNLLVTIQNKAQQGTIRLSKVNSALLLGKINELQVSIRAAKLQKAMARADVENFWNDSNFADNLASDVSQNASEGPSDDVSLAWDQIDQLFPVPETFEQAFAQSAYSPALIQAQISQKQARNQWYLAAASASPRIIFSFERVSTSTETAPFGGTQTITGNQFSVQASVNIGGGTLHRLQAGSLLEEAAQLTREATERSIRTTLMKLYTSLEFTREQIKFHEESLIANIPVLRRANPKSDKDVADLIHLMSAVDFASNQASDQLGAYIMNRIRIHGMMGTLLDQVARLPEIQQ